MDPKSSKPISPAPIASEPIQLTQQQARRFLLAHQGLWPPHQLHGKPGILEFIRRVGCIQFDPLSIAGHNQELVLQARLERFRPELLHELLYQERRLLDGWDKNMSIYLLEDWPYFRRQREAARRHLVDGHRPATAVLELVRKRLELQGPLTSADLEFNQTVDWAWAPTRLSRAALESMYFWGELVVHHKIHTRKAYDLAYRHIPPAVFNMPDPNPSEAQYHDWYVARRIGSLGLLWNLSGDAWLGMGEIKSKLRTAAINRLLACGDLLEIRVPEVKLPFYMRNQDFPALQMVLAGEQPAPQAVILAPLDNLLWDRRLVSTLFHFDYRWEVYKPVVERQYGYYVLPVLYGDRFVARFEPGREKRGNSLIIKNWWWEPGVIPDEELRQALRLCFASFGRFLQVKTIQVEEGLAQVDWLAMDFAN